MFDFGIRNIVAANVAFTVPSADATLEAQARSRAAETGETFAKAYSEIYCSPENVELRKGAPPDPPDPVGPAEGALNDLVASYMAAHPKATREMAFTAIYVDAANAPLKRRYDAEVAAKPFPPYTSPGHTGVNAASNVGTSGRKPVGYAGG
jgi:hypothetical protein